MKKLTIITVFTFMIYNLYGQLNIGVNGSYLLSTNGMQYGKEMNAENYVTNSKIKSHSYGSGVNTGIKVWYLFHGVIAPELGFTYHLANKLTANEDFVFYTYEERHTEITSTSTAVLANVGLRLELEKLLLPKIKPYISVGLISGFAHSMDVHSYTEHYINPGPFAGMTNITEENIHYSGRPSFGFYFNTGVSAKISEKIRLQFSFNYQSLSWAPKESVIDQQSYNGIDELSDLTTYEKNKVYLSEFTDGNETQNEPNKEAKFNLPYSGLGAEIQLIFQLGKKM